MERNKAFKNLNGLKIIENSETYKNYNKSFTIKDLTDIKKSIDFNEKNPAIIHEDNIRNEKITIRFYTGNLN